MAREQKAAVAREAKKKEQDAEETKNQVTTELTDMNIITEDDRLAQPSDRPYNDIHTG